MNGGLLRVWGWPVGLATLSVTGLLSALFWDGWGDAWSWVALGAPALVGAWALIRGNRKP